MNKLLSIVVPFLLASASAYAKDVAISYGKGVNHNPDTDMLSVSILGEPRGYLRSEYGVAIANSALPMEFARSFAMFYAAKRVEAHLGRFTASLSGGAALVSRTGDGQEFAVAPYGAVFIGARIGEVRVELGEWVVYRPNLSYPWEAGHGAAYHAADERWPTPVFSGARLEFEF